MRFPYVTPPELSGGVSERRRVVIVGAGPVGLACAVDLALHGIAVTVLDEGDRVSTGSRAICWSKRTLEILDRLGIGERMVEKGVTWQVGRLFHRGREVYSFDLLPETGHKMPAFVNLQQYHLERLLLERCTAFPDLIDLRWKNRVADVRQDRQGVRLTVETPDGRYGLEGSWCLACDGARSPMRHMLKLEMQGVAFEERFLIADVRMRADFPSERWFWFEPPFHPGQSALLHKQPDDVYRIDLQLWPSADPQEERRPARVLPRIEAMLGHRDFELEWVSVYSFRCQRLEHFVHDRIVFVGDSAHVVSPFGARGGNGGIQDADNLCWKLAAVIRGGAPERLIASYDRERRQAADENILHSSRSTAFMTPEHGAERRYRDAILALSNDLPFARSWVNSGRLSTPCRYDDDCADEDSEQWNGSVALGAPLVDAPLRASGKTKWLLNALPNGFSLLSYEGDDRPDLPDGLTLVKLDGDLVGEESHFTRRYDATPGACWLVRPDQHLAGRWRRYDRGRVEAALSRSREQT